MSSAAKTVASIRTGARNKAALILFGRTVVITLSVTSACLGFLAGIRLQAGTYDPHAYAMGASALFCGACAILTLLLINRRLLIDKIRGLEARCEDLDDRN